MNHRGTEDTENTEEDERIEFSSLFVFLSVSSVPLRFKWSLCYNRGHECGGFLGTHGVVERAYVVGTAGHVDHGKSTLVRALTGIDPDRLAEEKAREMTIDLGFAWLTLPSGQEVSIVDVPGHERFIKNMLAGVGGIDAALLVVAADEGPMPQTREHLAILDLLGIDRGLIVLTKADMVDEDFLELAAEATREAVSGTTLADAPLIIDRRDDRAGAG